MNNPRKPRKFSTSKILGYTVCDLSSLSGFSVNDGIAPELCSLQYATVDKAIEIVKILGRDAQLVKLDIKDAYRIVPIHPADLPLLGIRWRDNVYIDRALLVGLRSAPKLLTAIADLLAWVLACQGVTHQLHYLDVFLFVTTPRRSGPPDSTPHSEQAWDPSSSCHIPNLPGDPNRLS